MCNAGFGWRQECAACTLLMLGGLVHKMRVGKNFPAQSSSLHRHSRTRCARPGWARPWAAI